MKNCLIIMSVREIPECISAFNSLKIDSAWFIGYTEGQLEKQISNFINSTNYDNYIWASDDLIPTQKALDEIVNINEFYPVITGWCNMVPNSDRGNIRFCKFKGNFISFLIAHVIMRLLSKTVKFKIKTFASIENIKIQPKYFETWFMGSTFTSMPRELWIRFPFKAFHNPYNGKTYGSDFMLSRRLFKANIKMFCARDAFFYHLASHENLLLGKVIPSLKLVKYNEV